MPHEVEPISNNKSKNVRTILVIVSLCLFFLWYNDMWFFSSKENKVPMFKIGSVG